MKTCFLIGHRYTLDHSDYLIANANAPDIARELADYAQRRAKGVCSMSST